MRECILDTHGTGWGPLVSFCKHGIEYLGSIKVENVLFFS